MSPDLRPGPDSPPTDELQSAEATLGVLQQVLHTIGSDDMPRQSPCSAFDLTKLTGHLLNSIRAIGDMAGGDFAGSSARDEADSAEREIIGAARPTLDAWHRRGLQGTVQLGPNEMPARVAVGIMSVEFLVHAWDYAVTVGREVQVPDSLAEYVLALARELIKPEERARAGFDDPVDVPDDASALDRLIAFTGRNPAR
jgi:uncharacterized protein (TIGR03086 family)